MKFEALSYAVFGGSFSPVHKGHVAIAEALADLPGIRQVLVIPARRSPYKLAEQPLPDELRWQMLRCALKGRSRVCLLDLELRRPAPSYTIDTLQELGQLLPQARFHLALGWDAFQGFAGWHRAERILEIASLIVFGRKGVERPDLENAAAWADKLPPAQAALVRPGGPGRLVAPDGRTLLTCIELVLPEISASRVLRERMLEPVPEAARPLLADYWAGHKET